MYAPQNAPLPRLLSQQGVGSHAAHLLLRSGVGRLRLVDFDQVSLSSLNRHCLATRADVGIPKSTCLARHFEEIMPEAQARWGLGAPGGPGVRFKGLSALLWSGRCA